MSTDTDNTPEPDPTATPQLMDYHVVLVDGTEYDLQNVTGWGVEEKSGFLVFNGQDFPVRVFNREIIESFEPSLPLDENGEDVDDDDFDPDSDDDTDDDYDPEADSDSQS